MAGNDYVRLAAACCGEFKFTPLSRRTPRGPFTCGNCGVSYTTIRGKGEGERFCSRGCARASRASTQRAAKKDASRMQQRREPCADCGGQTEGRAARCSVCTRLHAARRSNAAYRTKNEVTRSCPHCSAQWCALVRLGNRQHCFDAACVEAHAQARRKASNGSKSHERRAKAFGVERRYFNPRSVLRRDGWQCKLCGVKTPEKLRGTLDPRAPELDHIVPLSQGGPHTKQNTQCACRRCNGLKGARPMGQTLLFG